MHIFHSNESFHINQYFYTGMLAVALKPLVYSEKHTQKKHIGRRGFAVAAPAEWNKLPQTVRSHQTIDGFRSQLKTSLV